MIIKQKCKYCTNDFEKQRWSKKKFCSHQCSIDYRKENNQIGGNRVSLEKFIERDGVEEGTRKYNELCRQRSEINKQRYKNNPSPLKGRSQTKESNLKRKHTLKESDYHTNLKGKSFDEIYEDADERRKSISNKLKGKWTIEWFIEQYGENEGQKLYQERCDRIKETSYFKIYNKMKNKNNYSKMSQKLFWDIYNQLDLKDHKIYFAELNHEYGCGTQRNFDFVDVANKKVIEFNGDLWHANPKIFSESDCPNPYKKNLTAKHIWHFDENKNQQAINNGYEVLIIWESDYKKNYKQTLKKCIKFMEK